MTTSTLSAPARTAAASFELSAFQRSLVMAVGAGFSVLSTMAAARAIGGWAPAHPAVHDLAVMTHLATVMPAVPLGAWLLLSRKGTPRHRQLGKVWLVLMVITAIASLFIRQLNAGSFSPIHLFVPLTLHGAWQAIATARRGDIAAHRKGLIGFYLGALTIPGIFAFIPGRLMGTWLLG